MSLFGLYSRVYSTTTFMCVILFHVLVQVYNVTMKRESETQPRSPSPPTWPPQRIYRALLTAKLSRPYEHTVLWFFWGSWDRYTSQEMAPFFLFFLRPHRQNVLCLPSAERKRRELQRSRSGKEKKVQRVCRITICEIEHNATCVNGSRRGRRCGLCVSRRRDRLVPETETRCEDPAADCPSGSSQTAGLPFRPSHGQHAGTRWDTIYVQSSLGSGTLLTNAYCRQKINDLQPKVGEELFI